MKKLLAAVLAAMMIVSLAACGNNKNEQSSSAASSDVSPLPPEDGSSASELVEQDGAVDAKLTEIHDALKKAYGEDYIPSQAIDATMLAEVYGVDPANVDSFVAEGPLMSTHVDTFIGIRAKDGKAGAVEQELTAYRDKLVKDSLQYPMNAEKVAASKVLREGDYVFFVMLGAIGDEEKTDDMAKFAEDQVKIGLDKIKEVLGK